ALKAAWQQSSRVSEVFTGGVGCRDGEGILCAGDTCAALCGMHAPSRPDMGEIWGRAVGRVSVCGGAGRWVGAAGKRSCAWAAEGGWGGYWAPEARQFSWISSWRAWSATSSSVTTAYWPACR